MIQEGRRAEALAAMAPAMREIYEAEEARCTGRRVLLVDDIVTTGATLEECARTLREAGAAEVLALTLGRTREKSASPGKTGQKGKNLP